MAASSSGPAAWTWPCLRASSFVEIQRSMTHKDAEGDVKQHKSRIRCILRDSPSSARHSVLLPPVGVRPWGLASHGEVAGL